LEATIQNFASDYLGAIKIICRVRRTKKSSHKSIPRKRWHLWITTSEEAKNVGRTGTRV